jgi:hypothetical protein
METLPAPIRGVNFSPDLSTIPGTAPIRAVSMPVRGSCAVGSIQLIDAIESKRLRTGPDSKDLMHRPLQFRDSATGEVVGCSLPRSQYGVLLDRNTDG